MDRVSLVPVPDRPAVVVGTMLVVADLHIGIEEEYRRAGAFIRIDHEALVSSIISMVSDPEGYRLVILGDVKHSIMGPNSTERRWVPWIMERLCGAFRAVDVFVGNHDGSLMELLRELPVTLHSVHGGVLDGVGFIHGNAWPDPSLYSVPFILMGHQHPHLRLARKVGRPQDLPCWLRAPLLEHPSTEVVLVPAFTTSGRGTPVNGPPGELLGPLLGNRRVDLARARVLLLDGTDMGRLPDLRELYPGGSGGEKGLAVVSDFDGTLTGIDGAIGLLESFAKGDLNTIERQFDEGEITLRELMEREALMLACTREEMEKHAAERMTLRRGARELVEFVERENIPMLVASEGFEDYIRVVLEGITYPVIMANRCVWKEDHIVGLEHPAVWSGCSGCGTCKRAIVERLEDEGYTVVYIGDGISDLCAAAAARYIFARDPLARYLEKQGIPVTRFDELYTVVRELELMIDGSHPAYRPEQ